MIVAVRDAECVEVDLNFWVLEEIDEVITRTRPCEHTDQSVVSVRIVAGILERLPRTFHEETLLRVKDGGFRGIETEERRIKEIRILNDAFRLHILRPLEELWVDSSLQQLLFGKQGDTLHSAAQVLPELIEVPGSGKST